MALVSYHLCGLLAWVYRVTWCCLYSARKPKRLGGHFTLSFPQPLLKTGRSVYAGGLQLRDERVVLCRHREAIPPHFLGGRGGGGCMPRVGLRRLERGVSLGQTFLHRL